MAAKKLTPMLQEQVKAEIAKWNRRGYTQTDIRRELKKSLDVSISQPMVSIYISRIKEEYKESAIEDRRVMVAEKLDEYREVIREAWAAWERSKEGKRRTTKESGENDKGAYSKESVTEEEMRASEYLKIVMEGYRAIREMLGLDEAMRVDVSSKVEVDVYNYDSVVEMLRRPIVDPVDETFRKALGGREPEVIDGGPAE